MFSISPVCDGKKGVLRMPNNRAKERNKPRCSVAFCETVEFRTVYVTKQERLGQFYDLTHWNFDNDNNIECQQNLIADFAATCIPLKDSDDSSSSRKIKRLFWNFSDENHNNLTISWLDSFSGKESVFDTNMDYNSDIHHFQDERSNTMDNDLHDLSFEELRTDFRCEEFEDHFDNEYIESEEISISIDYE
ncbi:hypothetical protein HWI79_1787 [Cryptosporidium felis]|nr:hypothetical protein HWI79_1787 [Cryptosporidium felis]